MTTFVKNIGMTKRSLTLVVLVFVFVFFSTDLFFLDNFRFSIEGLFTGFLALTGFIFTARTFITFKLNEVVYGNPSYQKYVQSLKREGAYSKELYDPLRKLDTDLGIITYMSLICLFLTLFLAFFPEIKQVKFPSNFQQYQVTDFIFSKEKLTILWKEKMVFVVLVQKAYTSFVASYLLLTIVKLLQTVGSMNRNIASIIDHWEDTYKENCSVEPCEKRSGE